MKSHFVQPRFDGGRFNQHTLPVEVARDFVAYEALVKELAKHLYLRDNPDRSRVPRGFDSEFQLHLEKVDEGSARPMLAMVLAGTLATGVVQYFEKARDLITQSIAAPEGHLPEAFPKHLLTYFNQFGRSLHDGEQMELVLDDTRAALTPDRRKHLVLAAGKFYQREVELTGIITEVDYAKRSFQLKPSGANRAVVVVMPDGFISDAREAGGRQRHQITVKGIGIYDSWDKLQRIAAIDSVNVQEDYQLAAEFDSLMGLQDGWILGGKAPDKERLSAVADGIVGSYPENLPLPIVVPTQEGNILFEWDALPGDPSVDVDLSNFTAFFHAFQPDGSEVQTEFPVASRADWAKFITFLLDVIPAIETE